LAEVERFVGVEMPGQDGAPARGDHCAGEGVLELSNVARPGPLFDGRECFGRE
jgi:hypothetical protein